MEQVSSSGKPGPSSPTASQQSRPANSSRRHPSDDGNNCSGWILNILILTLAIALFYIVQPAYKEESLKPHEIHLLRQSLAGYKQATTKLENMQKFVNTNLELFLKGLKTSGYMIFDVGVVDIRLDKYSDYLKRKFLSGDWSAGNQATMRRLQYTTDVKTTSEIDCNLNKEGVQVCSLSKLQVLARHFKDKEEDENVGVDKMKLFYSLLTVRFPLAEFKKVAETDDKGWFWNRMDWLGGKDQKSNKGTKQEQVPIEMINIDALGHFFLEYTENELESAFYKQIINVIDPFGKHSSLTDESNKKNEENF